MVDCTEQAKQVWLAIHPDRPWPKGWSVGWRKLPSGNGNCDWRAKRITLDSNYNWQDKDILSTLVHEFIHMHYQRTLKHGVEFRRVQGRWLAQLYGEYRPVRWQGIYYDPRTGKKL